MENSMMWRFSDNVYPYLHKTAIRREEIFLHGTKMASPPPGFASFQPEIHTVDDTHHTSKVRRKRRQNSSQCASGWRLPFPCLKVQLNQDHHVTITISPESCPATEPTAPRSQKRKCQPAKAVKILMASNNSSKCASSDGTFDAVDATNDASKMLEFFMLIGQLKTNKRTGWVQNNIRNPESISDHMYRMALMSMALRDDGLDTQKCIKMSMVHDLAECIVGDITPHCGVSKESKHKMEEDAMLHLCSLLAHTSVAEEMLSLWKEYCAQYSKEAKLVKDLDRFEMILQAFEYEKAEDRIGELESFYTGTEGKFQNDVVKDWVNELHRIRHSHGKSYRNRRESVDEEKTG